MTYPVRDRDAQHPRQARRWLTTPDGVRIDSVLLRGTRTRTSAVVLANGFTGTWRSPHTRAIAARLLAVGDVLLFDFRGHHASTGFSTVGDREVIDLQTAVDHLRAQGYTQIATLGFSMGAAVAVRHAGLFGGVNAVVAVSGPSRWFYQGTTRMRLLTFGVTRPAGRLLLRLTRNVRVLDRPWDPVPLDPTELAGAVAPPDYSSSTATPTPTFRSSTLGGSTRRHKTPGNCGLNREWGMPNGPWPSDRISSTASPPGSACTWLPRCEPRPRTPLRRSRGGKRGHHDEMCTWS